MYLKPRSATPTRRLSLVLILAFVAFTVGASFGCAKGSGLGDVVRAKEPRPEGSDEARVVVEHINAELLSIAERSRELGQMGREAAIAPLAERYFDAPFMSRATLGEYWAGLDASQQAVWLDTYEEFHVTAAAYNWRRDRGARFDYLGEVAAERDTILVKTRLDRAGQGVDMRRDYRMAKRADGWRVIDIHTPRTVSEVGMRRAEYLAVLTGQDFDTLVERMNEKIAERRAE